MPERPLLVSSSGGVLLELLALEPYLPGDEPLWAAVRAADTASVLRGRDVRWIPEQSVSHPGKLLLGAAQAIALLRREQPLAVVSAGTGVAVPFFIAARILGIRSLWVETLNLISRHGLAARACSRLATVVAVQRDSMRGPRSHAVLIGDLY
jgi:hypothetical protein